MEGDRRDPTDQDGPFSAPGGLPKEVAIPQQGGQDPLGSSSQVNNKINSNRVSGMDTVDDDLTTATRLSMVSHFVGSIRGGISRLFRSRPSTTAFPAPVYGTADTAAANATAAQTNTAHGPNLASARTVSQSLSSSSSNLNDGRSRLDVGVDSDDREALKKLCIDVLDYHVVKEDTQHGDHSMFTKEFRSKEDWTNCYWKNSQAQVAIDEDIDEKASETPSSRSTRSNWDGKTVQQLKELCKSKQIKKFSRLNRDDLIQLLKDWSEKNGGSPAPSIGDEEDDDDDDQTIDESTSQSKKKKGGKSPPVEKLDVFLASSDLPSWPDAFVRPVANGEAGHIFIPSPKYFGDRPRIPEGERGESIREDLRSIKILDTTGRFEKCGEAEEDMIPILKLEDGKDRPSSDFIAGCEEYNHRQQYVSVQDDFSRLDKRNQMNEGKTDLYLGLGLVRCKTRDEKDKSVDKLVNGPLLYVRVQWSYCDDGSGIMVRVCKDERAYIVWEIEKAIERSTTTEKQIKDLNDAVKSIDLDRITLWNSSTYEMPLKIGVKFGGDGLYCKSAKDFPSLDDQLEKLVISPGWCLFSKRRATSASRDAQALITAVRDDRRTLTDPVKSLLSGRIHHKESKFEARRLTFPLPTSVQQNEIARRLFVMGASLLNVKGPPGAGKTHQNVNLLCIALSLGLVVNFASSNAHALSALKEKLPMKIRRLFLDLSDIDRIGVDEFAKSVEAIIQVVSGRDMDELNSDIEKLMNDSLALKTDLETILANLESERQLVQSVLKSAGMEEALIECLELDISEIHLLRAAFCSDATNFSALATSARKIQNFDITFDMSKRNLINALTLEKVKRKVEYGKISTEKLHAPNFNPDEEDKFLRSFLINGKHPKDFSDWQVIDDFLYVEIGRCDLERHGFKPNSSTTFTPHTLKMLEALGNLQSAVSTPPCDSLKQERCQLMSSNLTIDGLHSLYRQKQAELQSKSADLVYEYIVKAFKERINDSDLTILETMYQELVKSKSKADRDLAKDRFSKGLRNGHIKYFPAVVIQSKHVGDMLPPDYTCDFLCIDEASQSGSATFLHIMRAMQVAIVGDEKQVNPFMNFVAANVEKRFDRITPDISTKKQLLPRYSMFDMGVAAFPSQKVELNMNFRSVEAVMRYCNAKYYNNSLVFVRPSNKKIKAIQDIFVEGTRDPKTGINEEVAKESAQQIFNVVLRDKDSKTQEDIGVGFFNGKHENQEKRTKEILNELLKANGLLDRKDKHRILFGNASQLQGQERSLMILVGGYSPAPKTGKIPPERDGDEKKENVLMSRAKNRMILIRSFGRDNLGENDSRHDLLRFFATGEVGIGTEPIETFDFNNYNTLKGLIEKHVRNHLTSLGYTVEKNVESKLWASALRVDPAGQEDGSKCALLHVENYGESKKEWLKTFHDQLALEGFGRVCLRISCLRASLDISTYMNDVVAFLKKNGIIGSKVCNDKLPAITSSHPPTTTKNTLLESNHNSEASVGDDEKKPKLTSMKPSENNTTNETKKRSSPPDSDGQKKGKTSKTTSAEAAPTKTRTKRKAAASTNNSGATKTTTRANKRKK